ncbi:hypothetical protein C5167_037048, partial [Papaver somniferum]
MLLLFDHRNLHQRMQTKLATTSRISVRYTNRKDHSTKVLVCFLVHLALRASMEEERARKDTAARDADEKGGVQASSSHDTTMTENAGIMSDGANTCDLMAGLMLVIGCPGIEFV